MSERTISGGLLRSSGLVPLFYSVQRNPAKTPVLQELRGGRAAYVEVPAPPSLDLGPCFVWQGATNAKGYAIRGRELVHRVVYQEAHGPLAPGLQVHHRCERPGCVNVSHLAAHTPRSHSREHLPRPAVIDEAVVLLDRFPRLSPGAIARLTGRNLGSIHIALHRAVADGLIVRVAAGEYEVAGG
jgi:hypothetical protein